MVPQNDTDYPSNGDDSSPGNNDVIGRDRKRKRNINIQNTCHIKRNRSMSYTNRRGKGKLVEAVKLRKKGRPTNFLGSFCDPLRAKYNGPRPIEASKLAGVMSCMQWIPEVYHDY